MSRDNEKNIFVENNMDYLNIALKTRGLRVAIIGGGEAGVIKLKSLLKTKAKILVISQNFNEKILNLKTEKIEFIKDSYKKEYIEDKHLIFICVNDKEALKNIIRDCEELNKIYLNASKWQEGRFIAKKTIETKAFNISINSKKGNPKGTLFISEKIKKEVEKYDDFIEYTSIMREKVKKLKEGKEILDFLNTDDFKNIFDRGKEEIVLKLFFEDIF